MEFPKLEEIRQDAQIEKAKMGTEASSSVVENVLSPKACSDWKGPNISSSVSTGSPAQCCQSLPTCQVGTLSFPWVLTTQSKQVRAAICTYVLGPPGCHRIFLKWSSLNTHGVPGPPEDTKIHGYSRAFIENGLVSAQNLCTSSHRI